ncbi:hypothetical protein K438DRAFT_1791580 [Mycena galopus ATCC 62051]|nr:hypothetical protein K438DRAFT_1791580 [Mycena galopus ATCC 62051]
MARNQEKAHSMFYRFREAQAVELGLGTRGDSRPRMSSMCKTSVCECERSRNSGPTSKRGTPVKSYTTKAKEGTDASSSRTADAEKEEGQEQRETRLGAAMIDSLQRKLNSGPSRNSGPGVEHPNRGKLVKCITTNAKDVKYGSTSKSRSSKNADVEKEVGEEEEGTKRMGVTMIDQENSLDQSSPLPALTHPG